MSSPNLSIINSSNEFSPIARIITTSEEERDQKITSEIIITKDFIPQLFKGMNQKLLTFDITTSFPPLRNLLSSLPTSLIPTLASAIFTVPTQSKIALQLKRQQQLTSERTNGRKLLLETETKESSEFLSWKRAVLAGLQNFTLKNNASEECANGSYFSYIAGADGEPVYGAVVKPADEECGAPNCPDIQARAPEKRPFRGIMPGEGPMREHVAYLLNRSLGIPDTFFQTVRHTAFASTPKDKTVSIQRFIPNSRNFDRELSLSEQEKFLASVPAKNIRDIALIDLRIHNSDRGAWNLMTSNTNHFVPIDHGACLSRDMMDNANFCWIAWPASHTAFDKEQKEYIQNISWEADRNLILQNHPDFPLGSLNTLRMTTALLKSGARVGMTPYEIASLNKSESARFSSTVFTLRTRMSNDRGEYGKRFEEEIDTIFNQYPRMKTMIDQRINALGLSPTEANQIKNTLYGFKPGNSSILIQIFESGIRNGFDNIEKEIETAIAAATGSDPILKKILENEKEMSAIQIKAFDEMMKKSHLFGRDSIISQLRTKGLRDEELINKIQTEYLAPFRMISSHFEALIRPFPTARQERARALFYSNLDNPLSIARFLGSYGSKKEEFIVRLLKTKIIRKIYKQ